jgi:ABC-type histidine transport system ATPase subunit
MMTEGEIEVYRNRLVKILSKKDKQGRYSNEVQQELQELALELGASTQTVYLNIGYAGMRKICDATIPELAFNIHQALQTASMVNACVTAAENSKIMKVAQKQSRNSQRIAFWAMLAAWVAVVVNLVISYIRNLAGSS